jgi:rSAM/selenodomain-associated transferase 1
MTSSALIIFVRNPVLGKVKSRLAKTLGEKDALRIYEKLLEHTHSITQNITVDKYVFYADYVNHKDRWDDEKYHKVLQSGPDLGNRMKNAFDLLFGKGYRELAIIGSDCYELSEEIILSAFNELQNNDVVIGPAADGGYYLIGMNNLIPQLFENKTWGSNVFSETVNDILHLDHSMHQLCQLNDVDEEKDVTFSY